MVDPVTVEGGHSATTCAALSLLLYELRLAADAECAKRLAAAEVGCCISLSDSEC